MCARELVDSSILFSDGLCVCALCEMFDVDYLVESGTGYGGSTEMIARYFERAGRPRIWSTDLATGAVEEWLIGMRLRHRPDHVWSGQRGARAVAAQRLRPFPHVTLTRGNALSTLPRVVARFAAGGSRIGVLIDGPKEAAQLQLAEQLLAVSPNVRFAALDDIGPKFADGRHDRFRRSRYAAFATSDAAYFERYRWVDRDRLPDYMRRVPNHAGYGLGVLVNR